MTPEQIERQRRTWAKDMLVMSIGRIEHLARLRAIFGDEAIEEPWRHAERALQDASYVAGEWGLDVKAIIEETGERVR